MLQCVSKLPPVKVKENVNRTIEVEKTTTNKISKKKIGNILQNKHFFKKRINQDGVSENSAIEKLQSSQSSFRFMQNSQYSLLWQDSKSCYTLTETVYLGIKTHAKYTNMESDSSYEVYRKFFLLQIKHRRDGKKFAI